MEVINWGVYCVYFQYNFLCLYYHFSLSVFLKLLKSVKLIVKCELFLKMYCKTEHLFFDQKIVTRFDKEIAAYSKQSTFDPREESITEETEEKSLKKKRIREDSIT